MRKIIVFRGDRLENIYGIDKTLYEKIWQEILDGRRIHLLRGLREISIIEKDENGEQYETECSPNMFEFAIMELYARSEDPFLITTDDELLFLTFRVLIAEGKILPQDVTFIGIGDDGNFYHFDLDLCKEWPDGFITLPSRLINRLNKANSEKQEITPATLASYLVNLPPNTPSSPHKIALKVSSVKEFLSIKTALKVAPDKYVNLDLTGSTVTSIENYAFFNCKNLVNVTLPDSITSIRDDAFSDCASLTSITIPDSVISIEEGVFSRCTNLTNINIPNSVTSIGKFTFSKCTSLTNITIPDSVTSIGDYAFGSCTSLASVTIPDNVTSIGYMGFSNCTSLTSVIIGNGVKNIGESAFYRCESLTNVTIGNSVISIEESAFSGCKNLTNITIPDNVSSIGWGAFNDCESLASVTFQGTISSSEFDTTNAFPDKLRDKFYETDKTNGTSGTYTRSTWELHEVAF